MGVEVNKRREEEKALTPVGGKKKKSGNQKKKISTDSHFHDVHFLVILRVRN